MSLLFSARFDISDQVWMLVILNNRRTMPGLIIQKMVFAEGISPGFSFLRPIVSEIEPWHPLFYFLRAPAAKFCMGAQNWHAGL